VLNGDSEVLV